MRFSLPFWTRRRKAAFQVSWKPLPDRRGWWLCWEPGVGDTLIFFDPSDDTFLLENRFTRRSFLGPFQLPL